MKALLIRISFSEVFFKVHYTRGFRLTYPIPLPTSVAGIFGAILGIERENLRKEFENNLFGAKLLKYEGIINESTTLYQYKTAKVERPVTPTTILVNPTFLIAMTCREEEIETIVNKIRCGAKFLPYGGQNDFFPVDWGIEGVEEVEESDEISNYAPRDWVNNTILENESEVHILPVRHTLSDDINFYFIVNGKLKLKKKILATKIERIGVYNLQNFQVDTNE